jgi:hypothetical protein
MLVIGMDPGDFSFRAVMTFLPPVQLGNVLITPVLVNSSYFSVIIVLAPVTNLKVKALRQSPSAGVSMFFHARQSHLIRIGLQELLTIYLGHGLIFYWA